MRTQQDARLCAGDARTLNVAVANQANANIGGMTAKYIVAAAPIGPTTTIISKTIGNGITVITSNVPPGYAFILAIALANDDTDDVPPGWYYHEAMITLADGSTVTVMSGQLRIDPSWIASRL